MSTATKRKTTHHDHVNDPAGFPAFDSLAGPDDLEQAETANKAKAKRKTIKPVSQPSAPCLNLKF